MTGLICFPLGYFSIMMFGVLGLIVTAIVAQVPTIVMGLFFVKRIYGFSVDFAASARILLSSAVAGVVTYFVVSELSFAAWVRLLLGLVIFVVVVVPSLIMSRSITHGDIANLRLMMSGIGALSGLEIQIILACLSG